MPTSPLVAFYRLVGAGLEPRRADRSVGGTLPTRAFRYCEPVAAASGFGWYAFVPCDFSIVFDGTDMVWTYEGADGKWFPLERTQYPDFGDAFDRAAPEEFRGFSPPFVARAETPGNIQVWTGLIARTAPGYSLLVRPPANWPRSAGYEVMEGIVETDRWFGPLFTNVQLKTTDRPLVFRAAHPFLQLQPVLRTHYGADFLDNFALHSGLDALTAEDWAAYGDAVVRPSKGPRAPGEYAVAARKRRADERGSCPVS